MENFRNWKTHKNTKHKKKTEKKYTSQAYNKKYKNYVMGICISNEINDYQAELEINNNDQQYQNNIEKQNYQENLENPENNEINDEIKLKSPKYIPRQVSDILSPTTEKRGIRQYGVIDGAQQQESSDQYYYIYKDEKIKKIIRLSMKTHPIFKSMDSLQIERVIDAMDKVEVPKGAICSQQGKAGRSFYTITEGSFSMNSVVTDNQSINVTLGPGHSFGEMFLFDAPRLYTVVAETAGVLWTIDRSGFRKTLEISEKHKIRDRIKFLKRIDLFKSLVHDEFNKIAEACIQLTFKKNEYIIHEGEKVDEHSFFYIIESGRVKVKLPLVIGQNKNEYATLKTGDFFGERSFITDEPRSTDVLASTNVILLALDKASFIKLLGPIEPILNRTIDSYGLVALKEIPVFSFLTQEERETIYSFMVKKTYKSEEVINYVGSKIDFNIIMQGEVIRSYSEKEKKGIKLYFI